MVYATLIVSFFIMILFFPIKVSFSLYVDFNGGKIILNTKINKVSLPLITVNVLDMRYSVGKNVGIIKKSVKKNNSSIEISNIFYILSAFKLKMLNICILADNNRNIDKKCILLGVIFTIIDVIKNTFGVEECKEVADIGQKNRLIFTSMQATDLMLIIIAITKILIRKGRRLYVDNRRQRVA